MPSAGYRRFFKVERNLSFLFAQVKTAGVTVYNDVVLFGSFGKRNADFVSVFYYRRLFESFQKNFFDNRVVVYDKTDIVSGCFFAVDFPVCKNEVFVVVRAEVYPFPVRRFYDFALR